MTAQHDPRLSWTPPYQTEGERREALAADERRAEAEVLEVRSLARWRDDDSPVARLRQVYGIREHVDYERAEQLVQQVITEKRRVYGRELSPREVQVLRQSAEHLSTVAVQDRPAPPTSHELCASMGWGIEIKPRANGWTMQRPWPS